MKYEEKLETPGAVPLDLDELVKALTDLSSQLTKSDDNLLKATGEYTKIAKMMSDITGKSSEDSFSIEDL